MRAYVGIPMEDDRAGMIATMRTTIDAAGRVVIPKQFRDALGLSGGASIEVVLRDGMLELGPAPVDWQLERRGRRRVAVPNEPVPPITTEAVREVLERVRRQGS